MVNTQFFIKVAMLATSAGCFAIGSAYAKSAQLQINNSKLKPIEITPEKNTGLDAIFVLNGVVNVSAVWTAQSTGNVTWYKFSNLGGAFAEEIQNVSIEGNKYTLDSLQGDMGYIIKDGDSYYYFWIVDYSQQSFEINSVTAAETQDCDATILDISGYAPAIHFYTINGRQDTLDREIKVEYNTLVWDEENMRYNQEDIIKNISSFNNTISITPPIYCNTRVLISGDRFLEEWGIPKSKESAEISATAVSVVTEAIQKENTTDNSNRIDIDVDGLGGSAPCDIEFNAYVTDAVIHYEWQMATDEEFENITYRINEQDMEYTFTEEGTTYIRFIGSNHDGSCEAYGDVYTVSIGASELLIPNAFSPGDDGVNDEWKVSYRSLLDFKCWIFDRHGKEIYSFDNPEKGWDGKKNGKYVKPGVYYYVIQATGSDGKKYKKSGDINIIKYNGSKATSSGEDDGI